MARVYLSDVSIISGNRAIEDAAVAWVIAVEASDGRVAVDTRGTGADGDVSSPPRTIEIKAYGRSARGQDLWLETRQVEAALRDLEFWVYVVENIAQGDPAEFRVARLGGTRLQQMLARRREQRYFTVPWPVGDYDREPPARADPRPSPIYPHDLDHGSPGAARSEHPDTLSG